MARGVNKVIIVGNLGKEPESKQLPSGGLVTTLSVATSESWTDKNSGEKKEITEWHRIVLFNRLAEIAAQYVKKGSKVYIEGKLRTRKWEKNGEDRYSTEILADELQMLDSKSDNNNSIPNTDIPRNQGRDLPPAQANLDKFDDDDIPF